MQRVVEFISGIIEAIYFVFVTEWRLSLPLVLGAVAIYLLLPRPRRFPFLWGALFGIVATGTSTSDTAVYFNDDNDNNLQALVP